MTKITKEILQEAASRTVPDIIAPNLTVLFCGINPGLYTAAVGHHFGRPGNRFWPALHLSGFTPYQFHPSEQEKLLDLGYGITNLVARSSAQAAEVSVAELVAGAKVVEEKVINFRPTWLAVLGVDSYRKAFNRPHAKVGMQEEMIGETHLWLLPNPSGLNAHYTLPKLAEVFASLRKHITT